MTAWIVGPSGSASVFYLITIVATHHGEIYLESCRGCYTTQAKTKLSNRRAENLMRELELLATLASVYDSSYTYPKEAFDSMWQTILLCHFHDVLPGSAIEMVNDDAATVIKYFPI
jgi:alpha-mannosidase